MRRLRLHLLSTFIVLAPILLNATSAQSLVGIANAQSAGSCGISEPAFCDTFDQPAATGNRSGQLNGKVWGVSRATGNTNLGQAAVNAWSPTNLVGCSGTIRVQPENDIIICNGQVREAVTDNDTVTTLAMYPKQPFDFAGRTGVVAFDVSNDSQGTHAAWPEIWMTDQPVPTPFSHLNSWFSAPRNGFGIRLGAAVGPNQGANLAPGCPNDGHPRWTSDSVVVVRTYVVDDQNNHGSVKVTPLDCVISASGPNGGLNHVEVHVAQNQIDVYATDAGTTDPLKHIAVVNNANLTLTRGLLWIEDNHYNGDKFNSQGTHTFAWDNFGFDGPVIARDLAFDANDALQPAGDGTLNLGWRPTPNSPTTLQVPGMTNISDAAAAFLLFNFVSYEAPLSFTYVINGQTHTSAWPYPGKETYTWRTLALPIPLTDLVAGTNSVTLSASAQIGLANVGIVLAGADHGAAAAPAPPAGASPTDVAPAAPPQPEPQMENTSPGDMAPPPPGDSTGDTTLPGDAPAEDPATP